MESRQRHLADNLKARIFDSLFPEFCVDCGKEGGVLCSWCAVNWSPTPIWQGDIFSIGPYGDPRLRQLIGAWKYQGAKSAGRALKDLTERTVRDYQTIFDGIEAVSYVPLHPRKKNARGFDQAEEISLIVSQVLAVPQLSLLRRIKDTESQAQMHREERRAEEFDRAFAIQQKPPAGSLLLVDDVYTTGTTFGAAAQILRQAGGLKVVGFTIGRG